MFELPKIELILFISVMALYLAAAIVGIVQLSKGNEKYRTLLMHLFTLAVVLEAVILVFRAVAIKAVPLTGLFESMIVLTVVFGVIYLVLGIVIRQVWFSSVMTWVILGMIVLTALIARPASEPHEIAGKPWALAHGMAMIFGTAMVLLAAVTGYIYLLGSRRLKHKQVIKVIGLVPNIQKLERYNLVGLKAAFVLVTIGLFTGLGGAWLEAERLGRSVPEWLGDPKIIGILVTWLLLGGILGAHHFGWIRGKHTAYGTILLFVLILFAFIGATLWGGSHHDFSATDDGNLPTLREPKI